MFEVESYCFNAMESHCCVQTCESHLDFGVPVWRLCNERFSNFKKPVFLICLLSHFFSTLSLILLNAAPFRQFPPGLLLNVATQLSANDMKNCALVCRIWCRPSESPCVKMSTCLTVLLLQCSERYTARYINRQQLHWLQCMPASRL